MLIEFKVSNFRSIREEQTFSLIASNYEKNHAECLIAPDLPGMAGVKFLKGAALFGANASGKSNVLAAVRFVARMIERSATESKPGDLTGAQPFKLDRDSNSQPSRFMVTFAVAGVRYVFGLAVTPQRVVEEYLDAYPKGLAQRWYHRTYNSESESYEWRKPSAAFRHDKDLQDKTRENALFLSVGPQFNHPQLTPIFEWFKNGLQFINLDAEAGFGPLFTAKLAMDAGRHDQLLSLLRSADFGVTGVEVNEREVKLTDWAFRSLAPLDEFIETDKGGAAIRQLEIGLLHRGEGIDPVRFDFDKDESAGTRRFFALAGPWMDILKKNYTVFIDEIDTSLHSLLVRQLLELLFCRQDPLAGSQVIFTTHNATLLDQSLMRRDQIWFTEKTHAGATRLYPLTDFQPRKDEALAKGYLAGRYGAIPYLPEGLDV